MAKKNIFLIICFAIIILGNIYLVSALDFDNGLKYENNDLKVKIKNAFGLGAELGSLELKSHKSVDEVLSFGFGKEEVVIYYDLNGWKHYSGGFGKPTFINMHTGEIEEKDYYFVEWREVDVTNYRRICPDERYLNGTKKAVVCSRVEDGTKKEYQWVRLENNDIPERNTRIGVKTYVGRGDHYDIILKVAGKKIKKHAQWTGAGGINEKTAHYYKLDAGDFTDEIGTNDGTNQGSTEIDGVINNGKYFEGSSAYINYTGENFVDPKSFSFWIYTNRTGASGDGDVIYNKIQDGAVLEWINLYGTEVRYWQGTGAGSQNRYTTNGANIQADTWYHIVLSGSGDGQAGAYEIWINGVNQTVDYTDLGVTRTAPSGAGVLVQIGGSTTLSKYTQGILDEFMVGNATLSEEEITYLYNDGSGCEYGDDLCGITYPTITLHEPTNNTNSTTNSIVMNATIFDDGSITNATLFLNNVGNETNSTAGVNNSVYTFTKNVAEGDTYWLIEACDNASNCLNSSTRLFSVDTINPVVSASNLTDLVAYSVPINSTWVYTASDSNIQYCYYNSTEDVTQQIITCNSTVTDLEWTSEGNKTIQFCANDTFARETCNTEYIWVYSITETQEDNPDPIGEGATANFNLTVNSTNIGVTTATLMINGTIQSPNTTTAGTDGYYFEIDYLIPDGWGNSTGITHDWFWNYTITGINSNKSTSTTNLTVYELAVDDCSTYTQEILNLSLRDEEANTVIDWTTDNTTVEVEVNLTSLADANINLEYSNTFSNETNPKLCVPFNLINNTNYTIDITIGFDSTNRVWEFWHLDNGTLDLAGNFNSYTSRNINLMDLLTADSTSFLFNYFDVDGQAVDGSIAHVFRKFIGEGLFREVERSKADQNGDTIVHLVEEDAIYYFIISLNGEILYTSSTYTALCQEVPCTINIEEGGESAEFRTDYDLIFGGGYTINESRSGRQVSLVYDVNESTTMNFTLYKYENDGTTTQVDTIEDTGLSGIVTLDVPLVAGNVSFFASVIQDDQFINSEWVDFEGKAIDYFGNILAIFLGALLILTLSLMAISTGAGVLIWVMVGLFIAGALGLFATALSTGVSIVTYLIVAGALLLWKLTGGRK